MIRKICSEINKRKPSIIRFSGLQLSSDIVPTDQLEQTFWWPCTFSIANVRKLEGLVRKTFSVIRLILCHMSSMRRRKHTTLNVSHGLFDSICYLPFATTTSSTVPWNHKTRGYITKVCQSFVWNTSPGSFGISTLSSKVALKGVFPDNRVVVLTSKAGKMRRNNKHTQSCGPVLWLAWKQSYVMDWSYMEKLLVGPGTFSLMWSAVWENDTCR